MAWNLFYWIFLLMIRDVLVNTRSMTTKAMWRQPSDVKQTK